MKFTVPTRMVDSTARDEHGTTPLSSSSIFKFSISFGTHTQKAIVQVPAILRRLIFCSFSFLVKEMLKLKVLCESKYDVYKKEQRLTFSFFFFFLSLFVSFTQLKNKIKIKIRIKENSSPL